MKSLSSYLYLLLILLLGSSVACSQNQWTDSVKKNLASQKEDTNKIVTLFNLSSTYTQSSPDSAFAYGQQALLLAEKLHSDAGKFWSIVVINKALYVLGNYALELDYAFKAFPLGIKLNDPHTIGWANGMLGDCYYNLGEYNTSIKYYRVALKTAEEYSIPDLSSLYGALTPVLVSLKKYDSALMFAKKGYELFKRDPSSDVDNEDNKYAKSFLFRFLGEAFAGKANCDSALFYYRMSISTSRNIQNELNDIDVYNGIAKIYKEKNALDSAAWYAKKALTEKITKKYPVGMLKAANLLADIYGMKNNSDSTLKYLRIALNTNDSLFNKEKTMAFQNIIFKEQEKDKEVAAAKSKLQSEYRMYFLIGLLIILLTIAAIIIKNKRQKQLQNIRNSIADDLHDDIGSTLSSISIMSELAKKKSPEALSLLASIGESTNTIQENMSDIVWAVNPKNDRLENVVNRMNQFASEILTAKNIELDFTNDASIAATKLTMEQRKNFYLFFKEVINNAAKYSDAKKVSISIYQKSHQVEMNISDNGKGFDTSEISTGNGMSTLKKRAAELRAWFNIQSHANEGTVVQLKFKIT